MAAKITRWRKALKADKKKKDNPINRNRSRRTETR